MNNKKLQVWLPLLLAVVMIAGMFFGFTLHRQTGTKDFFAGPKVSALQEAMDLIKSRYVDSVQLDSLSDDAINAVMDRLDPHSVYIPASGVQEAAEELQGAFDGIGIEFNLFQDTVNVVYVIRDGPGYKAGLLIGDKLIAVNDSSVLSKTLPIQNIRTLIRGKAGSPVRLTIVRGNAVKTLNVVRGKIPLPSLDASYMVDAATGYVKLNKFSETTYKEFMESLEKLKKSGLQKLILDLRGNGGGYVQQAVNVADEFLDSNKLIVYTQGTNIDKKEYRASKDGVFEKGKLIVLVDELTASASEILAGALQDWDRATIIGRRTFGKGLVQEQFGLSDGSALRLTVARYYTASGRSIQRPYDKGRKIYMEEIRDRYEHGEVINPDSLHHGSEKVYKTNGGKNVYGGGGISPDVYVPLDTSRFTHNITRLYLDGRFNAFIYQYYLSHISQFDQYTNPAEFAQKFVNTEDAWKQLVRYALRDSIYLNAVPAADKKIIEERIKAYLARLKWRSQGFYEVYNAYDPVFLKAKEAANQ